MIGGGVGFVGHIEVCDGVTISGFTFVTKSITKPGTYTSGMPVMPHCGMAAQRGAPAAPRRARGEDGRRP